MAHKLKRVDCADTSFWSVTFFVKRLTVVSFVTACAALATPVAHADDDTSIKDLPRNYDESRTVTQLAFVPIDEDSLGKDVAEDVSVAIPPAPDLVIPTAPDLVIPPTTAAPQSNYTLSGYVAPRTRSRVIVRQRSADITEYVTAPAAPSAGEKIIAPPDENGSVEVITPRPVTLAALGSVTAPSKAVEAVIEEARKHLGTPYLWGGAGPERFDCSGLVQWAYKTIGVNLPRTTWDQVNAGRHVSINDVQPGDLVFYNATGHVALAIGDGMVIHAPQTGDVVKISPLSMMPVENIVRVVE